MKKLLSTLILALIISCVHLELLLSPWGDRLELQLIDVWHGLRGEIEAPNDVVLLSMDEASYQALGLPLDQAWPRAVHAEMLKRLKQLGAKRAVMDILFIGPSAHPDADLALESAMRQIPTVLGVDTGSRDQGQGQGKVTIEELLEPYEPFAKAAEQLALPKMPEKDGFIREFILPRSHLTGTLPTLYEAAAGVAHLQKGIPSDRDILWYYGPPGTIPTYPYYQIFDQEHPLPPDTFKDKIVFVGLNLRTGVGPMQKDSFKVPFRERNMFGVEIQATAADNVLTSTWVKRAPLNTEALFMFLLTLVCALLVSGPRPQWGFLMLLGISLSWSVASYQAFLNGFFLPGLILIGAALPSAYLVSTFIYYLVTYRSQQAVEKAFRLYLPREMAKEMSRNPRGLRLGGESMEATALFTDIAGFTRMAEAMSAQDVSEMLNAYFSDVIKVVFEKKGTVIKFIGDAVFVIWGAPIKFKDHPQRAAEAALAIAKEVARFNATKKFPALHTRIGINTGTMVVGNLGSHERFDYTAIGDSVNLAARLEGLNKYFGTTILISENTKATLQTTVKTVFLGKIRAVGKTVSLGIFTIVDQIDPIEEQRWEEALALFADRKWEAAQAALNSLATQALVVNTAAQLYLEELAQWREKEPGLEWKGEITFTQK